MFMLPYPPAIDVNYDTNQFNLNITSLLVTGNNEQCSSKSETERAHSQGKLRNFWETWSITEYFVSYVDFVFWNYPFKILCLLQACSLLLVSEATITLDHRGIMTEADYSLLGVNRKEDMIQSIWYKNVLNAYTMLIASILEIDYVNFSKSVSNEIVTGLSGTSI